MRSEWEYIIAEDYCSSVRDGTHDSPKQTDSKEGKYLITSKHLQNYFLNVTDAYRISMSDYLQIIQRSKVDQWDILFSMIGTIGKIYQEKSSEPDYAIKNVGLFKMGGDKQKSNWLKYYLLSPEAKEYIHAQLRGSTQSYVPLGALRKMPIYVPPRPEQKAIVAVLSALDDKIELNNRINKNLEAQAQAIFKSWFVDFEPFRDGEFVDSELGPIPKEWRVTSFLKYVDLMGGGTPKTANLEYWNGDISFFTPKDISDSYYSINTEKHLTNEGLNSCNSRLFTKDTVFVTARGTVGKVAMAGVSMAMNQSCYAISSKEYSQFFIHQMTICIVEKLKHKASGAVFDALVTRDFEYEQVIYPPIPIANKYTLIVKPIYEKMLNNIKQNETLAAIRDTLLPKLMSGEIRVPLEV